jgi:hypothetical protein
MIWIQYINIKSNIVLATRGIKRLLLVFLESTPVDYILASNLYLEKLQLKLLSGSYTCKAIPHIAGTKM